MTRLLFRLRFDNTNTILLKSSVTVNMNKPGPLEAPTVYAVSYSKYILCYHNGTEVDFHIPILKVVSTVLIS